jgi:hypothetical protein
MNKTETLTFSLSVHTTGGPTATKLQETSIAIVEPTKCANAYVTIKNAKIDESVLCAGEPGKDTCQVSEFVHKYSDTHFRECLTLNRVFRATLADR